MFKRIMKIVGLSFCGVIGVFGIIAGVMAIRGDFKQKKIKPTGLYFSADETYFSDNQLLLSPVQDTDSFYFQVKADNEDCNVLGIKLSITSGADVIKIVDKNNSPITDAKIWGDVKIIPQTQGGINVGGTARISAISDDGLVATTRDLVVHVDVPVQDLTPSDDVKNTAGDNTCKTPTRDKGPVDSKRYFTYVASTKTFNEVDNILYDGKYYDFDVNKGIYKQVTTTDSSTYLNFAELYEDCYMATMFNDNSLNIDTLYKFYPNSPNSQNPINRDGYGNKNVEAFILDADDLQLATLSADGKSIISNGKGLTGDVRVLLAVYPTYAKQKLAQADTTISNKERIEKYMVSREIVIRIGATTIKDMSVSRKSLSLKLFEYIPLQLNNSLAENNLGMVIRDTADNPISSIYKYLKFSFVDAMGNDANDLGAYFTITNDQSTTVPDLADDVEKEDLSGNTQLYIYAKRYIPKAYMKISYVSGTETLKDVYVELYTTFVEPSISLNAGTGTIDKLIDDRLIGGVNNAANIIDLAGHYTVTSEETVYRTVLYFAKSDNKNLAPENFPVCVFSNKTYTNGEITYYLVGYTENDGEGNVTVVTDKLKANVGTGNISIIAVVVRTDYKGRIINLNTPKVDGEYVELDLADGNAYEFNTDYSQADGESEKKSSAMTASTQQLSVSIAYKVQNVDISLSAKLGDNDVTTEGDQKYVENTMVKGKKSNTFYLRESFAGTITLLLNDCYDKSALQTASDKGLISLSAVMYDQNGVYNRYGQYESIANYINLRNKTAVYDDNVFIGYRYDVELLKATPQDCYITFALSVYDYNESFPRTIQNADNTYEEYRLDNIVILSGAVQKIDLVDKNGDDLLENNSVDNPLILLAKWNEDKKQFDYTLDGKSVTNGENFLSKGEFNILISPSYASNKNYLLSSANGAVLSIGSNNAITIGKELGKVKLTISCDNVESYIYIELRLDTSSDATINITKPDELSTVNGYIEVPISATYGLDNYTDYIIKVGNIEYSHSNLLEYSNLIVMNDKFADITNDEKVDGENKFQLIGNVLSVKGTISQVYYIEINVKAPYASSVKLKLYLHSAVSVAYEDYATKNDKYQQIYSGTSFILMDQSSETAVSPFKIFVAKNLAKFADASGIKSVTVSTSADGKTFTADGTTIIPTNERYLFTVDSGYVGKYVKFTISFNIPADNIEYIVYVNDNLLVEEKSTAFIQNGTLTAYCGEGYNLADYITLNQFDNNEYAEYSLSNANKIADPSYQIEGLADFDLSSSFTCNWDWEGKELNVTYNGKNVIKIAVTNPYKIIQQSADNLHVKALTVVKLADFINETGIKVLKKAISFNPTLTYYNAEGREIVNAVESGIEDYYTMVDRAVYTIAFAESGILSDAEVRIGELNNETYLYVNKQTAAGSITYQITYYDEENESRQNANVIMLVQPNLPDDFIKDNRQGTSGDTIDLKSFINTTFEYDLFEWNDELNQPVKAAGEIKLSEETPFTSNDTEFLKSDPSMFVAVEPTDPRGDSILTFTVHTDFGYSQEFTVTIKSAIQLIATYPTHVSTQKQIDGEIVDIVYEQVTPGQTVNMFAPDDENKITRIKATRNGTETITTGLNIGYSYLAGRDDVNAMSLITINNNGSITFKDTNTTGLFAMTISVSNRELLYYFYLAPKANIAFTPNYSGDAEIVKVNKDNKTLDIANLYTLKIDGVDVDKSKLQYEICYSTNTNTTIVDSMLTFEESNVINDYIVVIYDKEYIYGYYKVQTAPDVVTENTEISWTPDKIGETLSPLPTFEYDGGAMEILSVVADSNLSEYLNISADNAITLKQFVPNAVTGVLTYKLRMMSDGIEIGEYEHKVDLTISPREYFVNNYNSTKNALTVIENDTFSLLDNEYNLAGLTVADNGLSYELTHIDGILYTNQDLSKYYEENGLNFTFKPVTKDVLLQFVVKTNFGYEQDLYIRILANMSSPNYLENIGATDDSALVVGNQFVAGEDGNNEFVFKRMIDLKDYLSITNRETPAVELLVADNFRLNATILSNWAIDEGLTADNLYSLSGTILTFKPLAKDLALKFTVQIVMSKGESGVEPVYFERTVDFFINLSANYSAKVNYTFEGDVSELVENGEHINLNDANFLENRDALSGITTYNSKRITFYYTAEDNTITEFDYSKIADKDVNNQLEISTESQTNDNIRATWDDSKITFYNRESSVIGSVTLRFKNQVGIDLTMTFKIYPDNTLDAISSIKYNGKAPSETNDHELILEGDLNESNDFVITRFGENSKVQFRYPSGEITDFVNSLKEKSVVEYDGKIDNESCFNIIFNESIISIQFEDANGNPIYPAPKMYTIHFMSRAGYLGSYKFTFSKDVTFTHLNPNYNTVTGESIYGSATGEYILDRVNIMLNPYTDGYSANQVNLSDMLRTSSEYNNYTIEYKSNSNYITIGTNDEKTRTDLLTFGEVPKDTIASVTIRVLYKGVVIASHDYIFTIREHLIVSLGDYNSELTKTSLDIYMRDFYINEFNADSLPESVEYDLTNKNDNIDGLYFTLFDVYKNEYAGVNDLRFDIDTASNEGITEYVQLDQDNRKLIFLKDVKVETKLYLRARHQLGEYNTFTITIKPSIAISQYSNGDSNYIYPGNEFNTVYSLDELTLSNTTNKTDAVGTLPRINFDDVKDKGKAPLSIYAVSNGMYVPLVDASVEKKVVSMGYAMFDSEEALTNVSTGYLRTAYINLTVKYDETQTVITNTQTGNTNTWYNAYSFTVPNVNKVKIMAVKVSVRLLGNTYYDSYYFIKVNPVLEIGTSDKYSTLTQILKDDLKNSTTRTASEYTLFNKDGKLSDTATGLFYWSPRAKMESFDFDKFSDNVIFVITSVDNGLTNKLTFGLSSTVDNIALTIESDNGTLFNNALKFRLYILAKDSRNAFEFENEASIKTYDAVDKETLTKLENNMIFAQDIEIKPEKALGIYTIDDKGNWTDIKQIDTLKELGLPTSQTYMIDYVIASGITGTSRIVDLIKNNFIGENLEDYITGSDNVSLTLNNTADYDWAIYSENITVTYGNFILTREFKHIESNSNTFVRVNYSTYGYRLVMTPEIKGENYINNWYKLNESVSLVSINTNYGVHMNTITEISDANKVNISLVNENTKVQIFTQDTKWYTLDGNGNYVQYNGNQFEEGVEYYYYDNYMGNYRKFDWRAYTLYNSDGEVTTSLGINLYIDLKDCVKDNVFTLPYEAWASESMSLSFNVEIIYGDKSYKSQIRILEISAKPNKSQG